MAQSLRPFCRSGRGIYSTPQITPGFRTLPAQQEKPAGAAPTQGPRQHHGTQGTDLHPQPRSTIGSHLQQHRLRSLAWVRLADRPLHAIPGDETFTQAVPSMPHACSSNQANRNGHGCRPPPSLEIQGPCQQKHGGQQPKRTKACCHSARWLQRMANCGRRMARRHACSVAKPQHDRHLSCFHLAHARNKKARSLAGRAFHVRCAGLRPA